MTAVERHPTNPNFPLNLNIHPSINPTASVPQQANFDANFGPLAQELAIRQYGIAGRVWEAAYAMISFIVPPADLEFDTPIIDPSKDERCTIIELGSGSGIVAATLAGRLKPGRDRIIATDLPEVCPLLENNLQAVAGGVIEVKPLSWGNQNEAQAISVSFNQRNSPLTHIMCSDLVYFPELLGPLLRSLLHITAPSFVHPLDGVSSCGQPSIYMSYKVRSLPKETMFWSAFGLWFDFRPVLVRDKFGSDGGMWRRFGADLGSDTTFLFVGHRRPESFMWAVPLSDEDLLGGVGASGTDTKKGDDTFENLLLMSLEP